MDFSGSKLSSRLLACCHINRNLVCPPICFDMERSRFHEREKHTCKRVEVVGGYSSARQ